MQLGNSVCAVSIVFLCSGLLTASAARGKLQQHCYHRGRRHMQCTKHSCAGPILQGGQEEAFPHAATAAALSAARAAAAAGDAAASERGFARRWGWMLTGGQLPPLSDPLPAHAPDDGRPCVSGM
jgi:hypothetical protein